MYSGTPAAISGTSGNDYDLTWAGSRFAIVWTEYDGSMENAYTSLFVDEDSPIEERRDIGRDIDATDLRMDWMGSQLGVTWTSEHFGRRVAVAILDEDGDEYSAMTTIENSDDSVDMESVWTGSEFGVSWIRISDETGIRAMFARIDDGGRVRIGPVQISVESAVYSATFSGNVALAWTGSVYVVVWLGDPSSIMMRSFDPETSGMGPPIEIASRRLHGSELALSWSGSELGLLWTDLSSGSSDLELAFSRFDESGIAMGETLVLDVSETIAFDPSLDWTGGAWIAGWKRGGEESGDLRFVVLDPSGNLLPGHANIPTSVFTFNPHATAWSGSELGVLWSETSSDPGSILFATITMCE